MLKFKYHRVYIADLKYITLTNIYMTLCGLDSSLTFSAGSCELTSDIRGIVFFLWFTNSDVSTEFKLSQKISFLKLDCWDSDTEIQTQTLRISSQAWMKSDLWEISFCSVTDVIQYQKTWTLECLKCVFVNLKKCWNCKILKEQCVRFKGI